MMESKSISGVTSTCSNPCTTPVGHTEDDMAYLCSQNPEVQHQSPGDIQAFPYLVYMSRVLYIRKEGRQ